MDTIGKKIDEEFVAEDFTGMMGELRELEKFGYLFPPHIRDFVNRLYDIAAEIVCE